MKIAVVVASLGRPDELAQLLAVLSAQTRAPDTVVLSVTDSKDVPPILTDNTQVVVGAKGLTTQRNRGLEAVLGDHDVVAFFDDDYLPSQDALAGVERLFTEHPELTGANGVLLADGIKTAGIGYPEAMALLADYDAKPAPPGVILQRLPNGLYGCNMVFRAAAIGEARFDERLPSYGWQEDLDFSVRVTPPGGLVQAAAFAGVHRGVKGARTSGVRLGYSQIINPAYLCAKGTMTWRFAAWLMARNLAANHLRLIAAESWVDRRGRTVGNWLGLRDLVFGQISPERMLDY